MNQSKKKRRELASIFNKTRDMEITTTKKLALEDNSQIEAEFKEFIDTNALNPLSLSNLKKVFAPNDKIVKLSGSGNTFSEAIATIKASAISFNPIAARHVIIFMSVKSDKISRVIATMDKFKTTLKYIETFKFGFTINQQQDCEFIVHIASAGFINEDEVIPLDLYIMDDTIHLNVMRRYVENLLKASDVINRKYYDYKNRYGDYKSEKEISLITIIDIATQYMSADFSR